VFTPLAAGESALRIAAFFRDERAGDRTTPRRTRMNLRNRTLALGAAIALAAGTSSTFAATVPDQFLVQIVLTNSCTVTANDLDFGSRTTLTANIDVNTTVDVVCTGANPVSIAFDAGTGGTSTVANRQMNSGANIVNYNIYTTAGRTVPLGSTAGTNTIDFTSTGAGATDSPIVYGRVPAQAAKPNGTYQSTVTATLTY
jgi:spore coat protein U-like protein